MALQPHVKQDDNSSYYSDNDKESFIKPGYLVAFILVTSLFFFWAIANNFNDILIKQFQKALDLSRTQSGLVQTAFYLGYFTMALPAGWIMQKLGYKNGILIGLVLYAAGALLFYPAAEIRIFAAFLGALYVIAAGLAFLETAANSYITAMGSAKSAAQRLNLAQSFNGFGGFLAPFIGGALIFSGVEYSAAELAEMTPQALEAYRSTEVRAVQTPYVILAAIVASLAVLIYFVPFPKLATDSPAQTGDKLEDEKTSIFKHKQLIWAVITQFFYVGAQVGIWSYFINYAQDVMHIGEKLAANYLGISLFGFMIGRFVGTALMRFIQPSLLLIIYGFISAALCVVAIIADGVTAVIALGATSVFMSIMFPTIFALGVTGLGKHTKFGSSLIIMAIIGGALFPPVMGAVADAFATIQWAMVVPLICFIVVVFFGFKVGKAK